MTTCALVLGALFCVPPVLSDEINVRIATTVKCLDRNSFTTQGKIGDFEVILDAVLYCPDGYICQEGSNYPCILDPNPPISTTTITTSTSTPLTKQPTTANSTPTTTSTITTTTLTTTTKTNPTLTTKRPPINEPDCKLLECFPGPKCDQFYECIPIWWWAKPIIRNCPQNYHFDKPPSCNCIPKQLSKCVD